MRVGNLAVGFNQRAIDVLRERVEVDVVTWTRSDQRRSEPAGLFGQRLGPIATDRARRQMVVDTQQFARRKGAIAILHDAFE